MTGKENSTKLSAAVLLALATIWIVWGSTYLGIKIALVDLPPMLLMASRFLTAGALLFAWLVLVNRVALPSRREWRDASVLGVLLLGGGMGATAWAQQTVPSGMAAMLVGAAPFIAAILSGLFGEWPTRRDWIAIAIGSIGIACLLPGRSFASAPLGAVSILVAILCWQFGSVLARHDKLRPAPGPMGFATEMLTGGAFLMICSLALGEHPHWPLSTAAAAAWAYLVVLGSLAAFSAYMYLLPRVSQPLATSYAYVNPVIAIGLGAWLSDEVPTVGEILAGAVVIGAVAVFLIGRSEPTAKR